MTTPPWYRFFPADYLKKTAGLSLLEHGCLRVLLDHYYLDEKLPADLGELYRVARAMTGKERAAVRKVVRTYFRAENDRLVNNRAEKEIAERAAFIEQRRIAGKASANARFRMYGTAAPPERPSERPSEREPDGRSNERLNHPHPHSQRQKDFNPPRVPANPERSETEKPPPVSPPQGGSGGEKDSDHHRGHGEAAGKDGFAAAKSKGIATVVEQLRAGVITGPLARKRLRAFNISTTVIAVLLQNAGLSRPDAQSAQGGGGE